MLIRPSQSIDLPQIHAIYAHHVEHGTGSFETIPPSLSDMCARWEDICQRKLPYLVALNPQGRIIGFAYAGPFRTRQAFCFTLEDSVYIAPGEERQGIGRYLLAELLSKCENKGYKEMIAMIGDSNNLGSIRLHTAIGFNEIGTLKNVGWKFNRWLDVVVMQKTLGDQ